MHGLYRPYSLLLPSPPFHSPSPSIGSTAISMGSVTPIAACPPLLAPVRTHLDAATYRWLGRMAGGTRTGFEWLAGAGVFAWAAEDVGAVARFVLQPGRAPEQVWDRAGMWLHETEGGSGKRLLNH